MIESTSLTRARAEGSSLSRTWSVCGKIGGVAVAVLVALMAYAAQAIYFRHWYTQDPSQYATPGVFRTNTTFIRHDVPVTYYRRSNMKDVLPKGGWIRDSSISGLQVFRLEGGEEPPNIMDPNILNKLSSPGRAVGLNHDCLNSHGLCPVCPPKPEEQCINPSIIRSVDIVSILNGTERDVYTSFAEMDPNAIKTLIPLMGWQAPEKEFTRGVFEHVFIGNFRKRLLPSTLHGNPLSNNLSYQFLGRKHWIFFHRDDYYDAKEGFRATPTNPGAYSSQAPRKKIMHYYTVTVQPGDFLYFPAGFGHMVSTEPGPNLLVTFRKPFLHQLVRQPIMTMHCLLNKLHPSLNSFTESIPNVLPNGHEIDNNEIKNGNIDGRTVVKRFAETTTPDRTMVRYQFHMVCPTVCTDDDPTNIDVILAKLIHEYADSVVRQD